MWRYLKAAKAGRIMKQTSGQRRKSEMNLASGDTFPQGALIDCSRSGKEVEKDEKDFQ